MSKPIYILAGEPVIQSTGKTTPEGNLIWRIIQPYAVNYGTHTETVPDGRLTDFASVPKKWREFFSSKGVFSGAAVKHDYDYFTGYVSKWEADSRFIQHLVAEKVSKREAFVMWLGVALFGGGAWNRHRKLGHPNSHNATF